MKMICNLERVCSEVTVQHFRARHRKGHLRAEVLLTKQLEILVQHFHGRHRKGHLFEMDSVSTSVRNPLLDPTPRYSSHLAQSIVGSNASQLTHPGAIHCWIKRLTPLAQSIAGSNASLL